MTQTAFVSFTEEGINKKKLTNTTERSKITLHTS